MGITFSMDECFPRNGLENELFLERYCSEEFNSKCVCNIGNEITCEFKPTEELIVKCDEYCTIEFMKFKTKSDLMVDSPLIVEIICTATLGYECSCYEKGDEIRCTSEKAKFQIRDETNGIRLILSEYNALIPYCKESEIIDESEDKDYSMRVERNEREKYDIIIENEKRTIGILASSLNFHEDSFVRPLKTNLEDITKLREILDYEFEGFEIEIIESIRIDLENIRDGDDIQEARIKFTIPKHKLKGEIIVIRIDDDGKITIIEPEIIDAGENYIILVKTDGLSLYAVATVNQISVTTSSPIEEEIKESSHLCGGIIGLILLSLSLFYIKN